MRRGFTLVELIVVLAILSIVTAIVAPSLFSAVRPTDLEQSENALMRLVSQARMTAVERGGVSTLVLKPRERRYVLQSVTSVDTVEAAIPLARSVELDDARPSIVLRFDAVGRASPERLVLRDGDRLSIISVDPWSGRTSATQR